MHDGAAVARVDAAFNRVQRIEPEHVPRVDLVGIAHQRVRISVIDRREAAARDAAFGLGRGEGGKGGAASSAAAASSQHWPRWRIAFAWASPTKASRRAQEARGDHGRALDGLRAHDESLRRAQRLREVVGALADAPLGRGEARVGTHVAVEEGVAARLRRPDALVEPPNTIRSASNRRASSRPQILMRPCTGSAGAIASSEASMSKSAA